MEDSMAEINACMVYVTWQHVNIALEVFMGPKCWTQPKGDQSTTRPDPKDPNVTDLIQNVVYLNRKLN